MVYDGANRHAISILYVSFPRRLGKASSLCSDELATIGQERKKVE